MSGYVIGDINIHDAEAYNEYGKLVGPTLEKYGGRVIVRGGPHEVLEGDWTPHRLIVIEFESVARAKEWYNSEEYAPALAIRLRAATTNGIIIEGA